jgi:hypothetical protein
MTTPLPATPAISSLYFRATLGEDQALGPGDAACRITWSVEGDGAPPPVRLDLSSESVRTDRRWTPVTITVPPHAGADWVLRVSVEPLAPRPLASPWITSGLWSARLP